MSQNFPSAEGYLRIYSCPGASGTHDVKIVEPILSISINKIPVDRSQINASGVPIVFGGTNRRMRVAVSFFATDFEYTQVMGALENFTEVRRVNNPATPPFVGVEFKVLRIMEFPTRTRGFVAGTSITNVTGGGVTYFPSMRMQPVAYQDQVVEASYQTCGEIHNRQINLAFEELDKVP